MPEASPSPGVTSKFISILLPHVPPRSAPAESHWSRPPAMSLLSPVKKQAADKSRKRRGLPLQATTGQAQQPTQETGCQTEALHAVCCVIPCQCRVLGRWSWSSKAVGLVTRCKRTDQSHQVVNMFGDKTEDGQATWWPYCSHCSYTLDG